jgi:hypothetical protein
MCPNMCEVRVSCEIIQFPLMDYVRAEEIIFFRVAAACEYIASMEFFGKSSYVSYLDARVGISSYLCFFEIPHSDDFTHLFAIADNLVAWRQGYLL